MSIHLYKNIDSIENKLNSHKYKMYDSISKQEKSKSPPKPSIRPKRKSPPKIIRPNREFPQKSRFGKTTEKPKSPLLRRGPRRFINSKKPT